MSQAGCVPKISLEQVRRLWFLRQGMTEPRSGKITRKRFVSHLEQTGGLQLDSVNVLDRAHYLTLWSRFGVYDRGQVDRWVYHDRVAYEYHGHEACLLAWNRLPRSRRAMKRFEPRGSWWQARKPAPAVFRHVLGRIRREGPLESAQFEHQPDASGEWWEWKQSKQALEMLWFQGRLATTDRRHFRRIYDLAERVYDEGPALRQRECESAWLIDCMHANGVIRERHLGRYLTTPHLPTADRRKVVERALNAQQIVKVEVEGLPGVFLVQPEDLEALEDLPQSRGTTLICPFDSLMWHRDRVEELLGFRYRIEIYVPKAKREFGYYVMPILHNGLLVGRLDPKLHRERKELEIRSLHLEPGFRSTPAFRSALRTTLEDLAEFTGAQSLALPQ